ncbi:alpha/beta fold hydrolase [Actinomycetospora sp. TBRC 11914]|uniref:alpha/beta fold hydrolase n=1 Tax=Actinomycetospora sp. TBRC 11914 TaxID=2729387 RepID=UPI00145E80AF|nr:alpha/beta hydrolase [Actinomycetospora sp. TBRC 11914]NMO89295.1 alpha/beta hydrolase [Actinomycetospora sp. TBRC 11914]
METFVLITGAWHGGWSWRPVATRLRAAGHRVLTPTMPGLDLGDDPRGITLTDCVDAVVALVEREDLHDVTLLGHSWGGYVVSGAAPRVAPRLARTVFWSAFVPDDGESLMDAVPPDYRDLFRAQAAASGEDNTVSLPFEVWQQAFMQDASTDAQRAVHGLLAPQPLGTFTEAPNQKPFFDLDVPSAYVLSVDDVALPPGEYGWTRFPERLGVTAIEAPGSHEANFTRPAELTDAFLRAVAA